MLKKLKASLVSLFLVSVALIHPHASLASVPLERVKPYETLLNKIISLKATFLQINPDGQAFQGKFYLLRPGYMRIEYAKTPDGKETLPLLLVAKGSYMVHYDKELKQETQYSLDATPAGFFLRDKFDLSQEVTPIRMTTDLNTTEIELTKKNKPDEGSLTLVFSENPRHLRKWIVKDAHGQETTVTFEEFSENVIIDNRLFDHTYVDPERLVVEEQLQPPL